MATTPSGNNSATTEMDEFIKKSRVTRAAPPKPAYDPLQFVQIKPAKLYDLNKAKPSTERKLELKTQREVVVEDAEEWQCNLDNWKSSRRKRVEHIIDKITEAKKIEQEEVCRGRKKSKTFSEMLENSGSRRRFILPGAEDDEDAGSFSDDPQDGRDAGKEQYKDDSTDERATDDTSSCCSSKQADGGSKTPELIIESPEVPEMNEFSLAIENYKSKFSLSSRTSLVIAGKVSNETTDIGAGTIESNTIYNETINMDKSSVCAEELAPQDHVGGPLHDEETADSVEEQRKPEEPPKVNVIERRRLFEQLQLQQMSCAQDAVAPATKPFISTAVPAGNGHEERYETQSSTSDEPPPTNGSSSDWLAAGGSIKERRAIFERYRSSEGTNDELQPEAVGRSRSNSGAVTTVVKSRSESNVGASAKALVAAAAATASAAGLSIGGKERYELTLEHLKRNNGGDCYEDSGIQSTDLSRSSVVSQADDNEMLSQLLAEVEGKSPVRSVTTLDSASEFSDTECGNGQLLENALDVAFEEMDSELNEYDALVDDDAVLPVTGDQLPSPRDVTAADRQLTECLVPPLTVISLPTDYAEAPVAEFNDDLILLSSLPKSKLTPPKEKPPPPPVDDEPEHEPPQHSTTGTVASWVQKNALAAAVHSNGDDESHLDHGATNGNGKNETLYEQQQNGGDKPVGREDYRQLSGDEQWRSLESYEVVQQVQRQQSKKQAELLTEKDHQQDQEQQELLVYSNRIETQPSVHHHPLYDARDHEEIVSVERELLQIEQEELQRRREKQIFYEKLTKTDSSRLSESQPQQQQQQTPQQHQPQREQQPFYNTHHHQHLPHHHHHHNHHNHHHRASMPAIDSRSLQNVNAYASFDTPFLDDVGSYEMGSLHRESMPNLSQVAASSSHPSSLSSYGEEYSTNSGASFDGGWPTVTDRHPVPDRRPAVAPRPMLNGFPEHHHHRHTVAAHAGGAGFQVPGGDRTRLYSNMLEQHPKDNKQNAYHPTLAMVNRGQGGNAGNANSSTTTTTLYGQHWLVQEAEQRRIEQHQKNATSAKRPLPKFVIDAITQRVQKLNAGSSEHSDNLSEDSDLAMINSMKHHHHQHHNQPQPLPAHHHHQPPPAPVLPPASQQQQQQQYSNATDKVLSVSGKKECSHCRIELGKGAAMAIESLGLFYHIECFKCCVCHVKLGDGTNGIDVRVRKYRLHCQNCFSSEDGVKFSCV